MSNAKYFIMRELGLKDDPYRCRTCGVSNGNLSLETYGKHKLWMCSSCKIAKDKRKEYDFPIPYTPQQLRVLKTVREKGDISAKELDAELGISISTAQYVLRNLKIKGDLDSFKGSSKIGKRSRRYYINEL